MEHWNHKIRAPHTQLIWIPNMDIFTKHIKGKHFYIKSLTELYTNRFDSKTQKDFKKLINLMANSG